MNQQQIDPISQAMQILQFVTQRRGQQAEIDQGQQRLDLGRAGLRMDQQRNQMQQEQFQQGMDWDRERAMMLQEQQAEQMRQALVERAMQSAMAERTLGAQEQWRKQQMDMAKSQNIGEMLPMVQQQARMPGVEGAYQAQLAQRLLEAYYRLQGLPLPPRPQASAVDQMFQTTK